MPDRYTPQAIASIIEQLRKQPNITNITVEDRGEVVVVSGDANLDGVRVSGVLAYLIKA